MKINGEMGVDNNLKRKSLLLGTKVDEVWTTTKSDFLRCLATEVYCRGVAFNVGYSWITTLGEKSCKKK